MILRELVRWENTTNEDVLQQARTEIRQSWRRACAEHADHPRAEELFDRHTLPAFHDPFAGGGALPLEAQRLGLEAHASDLNPVAVLINKAMIEIPPRFAGRPPVNAASRHEPTIVAREWGGAQGLAEDVRHYGQWMRNEAEKRIGHLYPTVEITGTMVQERPDLKPYESRTLTVIAWLWARTVKSPNPAFADVDVPLASTFMLSTKKGKEAYVEPVIERRAYRFAVKVGAPSNAEAAKAGTKLSRGANLRCVMSGSPITGDYIKSEGQAGRLGARLMAIVAEGDRRRVYLAPTAEHQEVAATASSEWRPEGEVPPRLTGGTCVPYGLSTWDDLFTPRRLVALTTLSDLVGEATQRVRRDAASAGPPDDDRPLRDGGTGATAYAEAKALDLLPVTTVGQVGLGIQADAARQVLARDAVVSTDPPYYDNIGYADLSDFFYVWLRRTLRSSFPELFATLAVPKAEELVATPYRHGGKEAAEAFFLEGMTQAMRRLAEQAHPGFPVTIYYAFKQSETKGDSGTASTGWETFLDAVIQSGFAITGTWPMRTERSARAVSIGVNALASSIVLVCRRHPDDAPAATRREFLTALRTELPQALRLLQTGNVAPVDLAQAAIGPGMGVYTRYARVLDAAGKPMSVREALALINQILDEVLAEQEGDFDADSRWAVAWFEQHGFDDGDYGDAETLSKAKNTSVAGMVEAGILKSRAGRVQLLRPAELSPDWNPEADLRLTAWEMVHHVIRVLEGDGEEAAAALVRKLGGRAEAARELCYRLYAVCERRKRAAEAPAYNGLVQSWPEISRLAAAGSAEQGGLFGDAHGDVEEEA